MNLREVSILVVVEGGREHGNQQPPPLDLLAVSILVVVEGGRERFARGDERGFQLGFQSLL